MKKMHNVLVATLLASVFSTPLLAAEPSGADSTAAESAKADTSSHASSKAMTDQEQKQYREMVVQASRLMGHVGIANIAVLHDMIPEATANTKAALEIARKLESETGQFNSEMMKLGKLQFKTDKGQHDFWLPVLNDAFAVRTIDSEYMKSKKPNVEIADAQLVHTRVMLDTKAVLASLEKADAALKAKNYGEAQSALNSAADSAFTEQDVHEMPLETVRDNLVLARELAKDKNYGSAGFALSHAEETLKEYQSAAGKEHAAKVEQLHKEVVAMKAEIAKGKPSLLKETEAKISKWIHEVEQLAQKKKS